MYPATCFYPLGTDFLLFPVNYLYLKTIQSFSGARTQFITPHFITYLFPRFVLNDHLIFFSLQQQRTNNHQLLIALKPWFHLQLSWNSASGCTSPATSASSTESVDVLAPPSSRRLWWSIAAKRLLQSSRNLVFLVFMAFSCDCVSCFRSFLVADTRLQLGVSVGPSICWSVHHISEFQSIFAVLLLPNRPRLDCRVSGLVSLGKSLMFKWKKLKWNCQK